MRTSSITLAHFLGVIVAVGSGAVVAAQTGDDEPLIAPTGFTGTIRCVEIVSGGSADVRLGITVNRGEIYLAESEISDERLDGSHTVFFNSDNFKTPGSPSSIGSGTWVINNDAGTWEGSYHVIGLPVDGSVETTKTTVPLFSQGAYDGLTAIWEADFDNRSCSWSVRGLITGTELPPVPEPSATQ